MPWPESHADFVALVDSMRAKGVVSAFGVVLGPPPSAAAALAAEAERSGDPEAARLARVAQAREDMRQQLAHTGREYSNKELDEFIGPVE